MSTHLADLAVAPASRGSEKRLLRPIDLTAEPQPIPWLVRSVVPVGGKLLIAGQANSGKSFLALDLALTIILGVDWLGCPDFQVANNGGPVLVIDEESPSDEAVLSRIRRLALGRGIKVADSALPHSLAVYRSCGFRFGHAAFERALLAEIAERRPCLMVLDSAVRVMTGSDNESQCVAEFWNHVSELNRLGPAVAVVHHAGWMGDARPRGSTDWRAGCDVELDLISRGQCREVSFGKVRDAAQPDPFRLEMDIDEESVRLVHGGPVLAQGLEQQALEERIWVFVASGTDRRRPKGEVTSKFIPGRQGKTQFYDAVRVLRTRRRLVVNATDYLALQ